MGVVAEVNHPLVSLITPTRNRERLLAHVYECFLLQDWPNLEWIVEDDSSEPSATMLSISDPRIQYNHRAASLSVGEKRNRMIESARGEVIVHFDDDDYYGPTYVSRMLAHLVSLSADVVKLGAHFLYDQETQDLFYWDLGQTSRLFYSCMPRTPRFVGFLSGEPHETREQQKLGYGFSYVYRRSLWTAAKFPDKSFNEDLEFMAKAVEKNKLCLVQDVEGICLHVIHASNLSGCFPQYLLPPFMIEKLFPAALGYIRTA